MSEVIITFVIFAIALLFAGCAGALVMKRINFKGTTRASTKIQTLSFGAGAVFFAFIAALASFAFGLDQGYGRPTIKLEEGARYEILSCIRDPMGRGFVVTVLEQKRELTVEGPPDPLSQEVTVTESLGESRLRVILYDNSECPQNPSVALRLIASHQLTFQALPLSEATEW